MVPNNTPFRILGIAFLGIVATTAFAQIAHDVASRLVGDERVTPPLVSGEALPPAAGPPVFASVASWLTSVPGRWVGRSVCVCYTKGHDDLDSRPF
jgi:hypothetical protein